ncbi:MAG: ABC transporter ATP-binding protein/permease [Caldilineales bacterium]|nr:ABC transporter ATP-binding protein/permease [Caldilineales bacterium]
MNTLDHLGSRARRAVGLLPLLPRALQLVWAASPRWTAAWLVLLALQGLLPAAVVYLTRALVDSLAALVSAGGQGDALRPTALLASAMALLLVLAQALRSLVAWVRTAQSELVQDHLRGLIHDRSLAADLAFYDQPDYFDRLHRARLDAAHRPLALLEALGGVLQNGVTLAVMLAVLTRYGWGLPLVLAASTLPALVVVLHYAVREHQFRLRTTADERRTWYLDWLLTARETAAEIRLFALGPFFRQSYQEVRRRLRQERLALIRSQGVAELSAGVLGLLATAAAVAWMAWRSLQGQATLGDLALVYAAFSQGQGLMRTLLDNLGQIYANSLFLEDFFQFLAIEPTVKDPPSPRPAPAVAPGLRFVDVCFRYPGSQRPALDGFNLEVPAAAVAAIVGANGAGKSTLVKLLCRFYDPQEGRIEVDGVDLRRLSLEQWRRQVAVLFQEPVQYNATVAENIGVGDLARAEDRPAVEAAAWAAGADQVAARLPQGYDTLLGVWFEGGTDLSVGEWQRLALARAYLRQASLIVLDEPTSAMDPWAEADWLGRFRRLAAGRTALIITHRFTTARFADVIHVMEAGRIVESGTHEELLAQQGRYAAAWRGQQGAFTSPMGALKADGQADRGSR